MRRNYNLELQLLPSAYSNNNNKIGEEYSSGYTDSDQLSQQRRAIMEESASYGVISPKPNQPLTIFYNGKICVCDVDEFQAKAILLLANREADERVKTPTATTTTTMTATLSSPSVQSPVYSPTASLSMKKSLQSFLQKRKHRAQAVTPYHR